jgi:heat shock transcription factor
VFAALVLILFADLNCASFLEESRNTDLIRWSDRGDSFVVLDEDEFAKTLIPELFKHNNYASFVRQLNMYGFHKRVGLSDNSMKASERKNKSPSEYYNPYFKRGHPNLLWLINKPKGGGGKSKKARQKNEAGDDGDSDDDGRDVEEVYGNNIQASRALSAAPEAGPLQKRDVAALQGQLQKIQEQQSAITNAIQRLRKDHNQLYQQSMAFQTLHDRHENSINAILTFLATVYNRSLDGQGPQNIAQMFANGIPHTEQQQGNVVDIGDITNQQQPNPGNLSPHRRQQRLLMAPPGSGGRATTASPSTSDSTPQAHGYSQNTSQPGAIEELFETSPANTTQIKTEPIQTGQQPGLMMNIINNTNARSRPNNNGMQFPEMLSHYENANGNSPLTSEQRNTMLNLIANTTSAPGTNNALVSPTPPEPPSLEEMGYTQAEIDELVRLQAEQEARIHDVKTALSPLISPSGSIPGLDGNSYFNGTDSSDPNAAHLDLDQFLDTGAFYNGSSPITHGDYNYDHFNDGTVGMGDSHFDMGMDGVQDTSRVVETVDGSETTTPEPGAMEEVPTPGLRSPSKRRRKN